MSFECGCTPLRYLQVVLYAHCHCRHCKLQTPHNLDTIYVRGLWHVYFFKHACIWPGHQPNPLLGSALSVHLKSWLVWMQLCLPNACVTSYSLTSNAGQPHSLHELHLELSSVTSYSMACSVVTKG